MIPQIELDYFEYIMKSNLHETKTETETETKIDKQIKENLKDIFIKSYQYHQIISEMKISNSEIHENSITKLEKSMLQELQESSFLSAPSTILKKYINAKSKLKTEDDIVKAIASYQKNNNQRDFDEIIKKYSKLMSKMIWMNSNILSKYDADLEFDEIFHVMISSVQSAMRTFDPTKGVKFITHLNQWLWSVITNPSKYIGKLRTNLKSKNVKDIKKYGRSKTALSHVVSGDTIMHGKDGSATNMFDKLVGDDGDFEQDYLDRKKLTILKKIINKLPEKERILINIKFGFVDNEKYKNKFGNITDTLIAKDLGMSIPTVGNTLATAFSRIKKQLAR